MTKEIGAPIPCSVLDPVEDAIPEGHDAWWAGIVSAHSRIFQAPKRLPECGKGWRHLIEDACREIDDALRPKEGDTINLVKIIRRVGVLHILWEGILSARARTEVERAIERAIIKSVSTCEICGDDGRLYVNNGLLLTACTGHRRGKYVDLRRKIEFVHIVRGIIDGQERILSCRQYGAIFNIFFDIPPESLDDFPPESPESLDD